MKTIRMLSICCSLSFALVLTYPVSAVDLGDLPGAADSLRKGKQLLEAGEATATVAPVATSGTGLTGVLMQQLGVSQPQAESGAGALFQLAKSRMSAEDFSTVSHSVPEMEGLLAAAPALSPLGGGGMAATFLEAGLKPDMVQKFIPIILTYVEGSGGSTVAAALKSALMGGM